jgi:hypothetical protein
MKENEYYKETLLELLDKNHYAERTSLQAEIAEEE